MSLVDLRLCELIIGQHFGEINQKVALCLAKKGGLTVGQLCQNVKLPGRLVKESLFVLIHHSLVKWENGQASSVDGPTQAIYHLDLPAVFLRLTIPLFASVAEQRHGSIASELVMEVAKHGRLNIIDCPAHLKEALSNLLDSGLVEKISPNVSFIENLNVASGEASTAPSPKKRKSNLNSPVKSKKVKFMEEVSVAGAPTFVRLALKPFINAVWFNLLVDITKKRINDSAGEVINAVFSLMADSEATTQRTLLNSFQISHKLPKTVDLPVDNESQHSTSARSPLSQYLECMAQEIPFFVKAGDQTGGQFYVDFYIASDDLIKRYLEAYIATRFGQASARIFKILLAKKFLEEKTISKIAMISGKEARERLYVLLNAGLVLLQEVPRTVDHAPSRTIFLWTVDTERLRFQFAERLKKGFVNLLSRISSEKERCSLLISKTERTDVAANPDLLSPSERSQLLSLNRMLNRLQHQVNHLSLEYLAFAHFKP